MPNDSGNPIGEGGGGGGCRVDERVSMEMSGLGLEVLNAAERS